MEFIFPCGIQFILGSISAIIEKDRYPSGCLLPGNKGSIGKVCGMAKGNADAFLPKPQGIVVIAGEDPFSSCAVFFFQESSSVGKPGRSLVKCNNALLAIFPISAAGQGIINDGIGNVVNGV